MPPPKTTTLTPATLSKATWAFGTVGSDPYAPQVCLFENGRIGGYADANESRWQLRDGTLVFLDRAGTVTTTFDEITLQDGRLGLTGPFRGGDGRHYLREVEPIGAIPSASEGVKPQARAGLRKRANLVVLRAGPKSLHKEWARDIGEADRNWDLCLSWYSDPATFEEDPDAEYHSVQPGSPKFQGLYELLYKGSPLYDYDFVMFPDDDLAWSWRGVNTAFETMREFGLMLAQPSLERAGHPIHEITIRNPETRVRFTDFVEVMTPIFSREALRVCAKTFGLTRSGFGLDHIWPRLLGDPAHRIGIIDDTAVVHTRPQAVNYDMGEAIEEGRRISDAFQASWRYNERGRILR